MSIFPFHADCLKQIIVVLLFWVQIFNQYTVIIFFFLAQVEESVQVSEIREQCLIEQGLFSVV